MTSPARAKISLPDAAATEALARRLAPLLVPGDTILLSGEIGAGKSTLARALIKSRLHEINRDEDVPSPTFTLVQTYEVRGGEIWHCDLYRLNDPDEILDLGLEEAFDQTICLIEWPDRLGPLTPPNALWVELVSTPADTRNVTVSTSAPENWGHVLPFLWEVTV